MRLYVEEIMKNRLNINGSEAVLFGVLLSLCTGCSATLDKASVQATEGAPESSTTATVSIPRNPSLPTFVVAIEPFIFSQTFAANENAVQINIRQGGETLAAKLTTALSNSGNLSVVDSGLSKSKAGMYVASLKRGEKGPYIVRATITEFNEVAEAESESSGGSLGWVGLVAGVAGAIAGKPALGYAGAGLAAANPTIENDVRSKKGVVAIDFRVVDGKSGRIVGAFKSSGTFKSASASSGFSLFGIGKSNHKFAESALGQAITVALNDAVRKITDVLITNKNV